MGNKVLIALRIGQLICLIIALGTLAAGATKCFMVGEQKVCECWKTIDVGQWPTYDANANSRMGGQYFVLVACVVFIVVSLILLIIECMSKIFSKIVIISICIISGLVMLIAGIVEVYYAVGSGMSWQGKLGEKTVTFADTTLSWIGTSVFLFAAMILYFGDAVITLLSRRSTYTPKQQPPK